MATTTDMIKELRQLTGAGVLDCKRALMTGGDIRGRCHPPQRSGRRAKKAEARCSKGASRRISPGQQAGSLIEVNCRPILSPGYRRVHRAARPGHAGTPPTRAMSRGRRPDSVIEAERSSVAQMSGSCRSTSWARRGQARQVLRGKGALEQPFIKDETKTVQQLTEAIAVGQALSSVGSPALPSTGNRASHRARRESPDFLCPQGPQLSTQTAESRARGWAQACPAQAQW